jgi:hypothetical protein
VTVSVEEIDRWDAGDVREVFHASRDRAEAAREAANGIAELPAFGSWGGEASEAAKDAIGRTRRDLDAHANEALAVAQRPVRPLTTSSRSSPGWRSCAPKPSAWEWSSIR